LWFSLESLLLATGVFSLSGLEYVHFVLAGERLRLRFCFDAIRPLVLVFRVFRVLAGLMWLVCLTFGCVEKNLSVEYVFFNLILRGVNEVRHVFLLVSLDEEVGDLCPVVSGLLEVVDILRGA